MSKASHASIGTSRASWAFGTLAMCYGSLALIALGLPALRGGFSLWFHVGATAVFAFILVPIYLFYELLFKTSTVGKALSYGTFMVVYSIVGAVLVAFWELNLKSEAAAGLKSTDLLSYITIVIGGLQSSLSLFSAAVGGGIVAACIFQSRVDPRAPDTKTGVPNKK